MSASTGVSRYYAVAGSHHQSAYTLIVRRRTDGHEVWGDQPLPAARWTDIPAAATARLLPTAYRLTTDWAEVDQAPGGDPIHGRAWVADADVR